MDNGSQAMHCQSASGVRLLAMALLPLTLIRGFERFLDQIRIIEMPQADERRGVVSPLAHGAGTGDAHRPKQQALAAFGAGDQAIGTK